MLDSLDLLMIVMFCENFVYTCKHNIDHFSTFKMVHKMGSSWISFVQLVDGPI
jgi:hypothetical protein